MITGTEPKEPKFSIVKQSRGPESVTDSAFEEDSAFVNSQGLIFFAFVLSFWSFEFLLSFSSCLWFCFAS